MSFKWEVFSSCMVKQNLVHIFSNPLEEWEKLPVPQLGRWIFEASTGVFVIFRSSPIHYVFQSETSKTRAERIFSS